MSITKIQPLHPPLVPPQGAKPAGVTVDGQQLYTEERARSKSQPKYERGPDGEYRRDSEGEKIRIWKKNQLTGEPLIPMNEPVPWTEKLLYTLESQGNGNVVRVMYHPPTEADLLAAERRQKITKANTAIAEAFVDLDMDPTEALNELKNLAIQRGKRILGQVDIAAKTDEELKAIISEEAEAEEGSAIVYPLLVPGGMYEFSDGSTKRMKKEFAFEHQAQITASKEAEEAARADAKANAKATPEF